MFTQIENPFEVLVHIPSAPIKINSSYSKESSNTWAWILGILALFGGIFLYFFWKEKNEEEKAKQVELSKNKNDLNKKEVNV